MEYLLLRDGSVRSYSQNNSHDEVLSILREPDAFAYYWSTSEFDWSCFTLLKDEPAIEHRIPDVPDIIKLASMLE